jgi:hypothetical protein
MMGARELLAVIEAYAEAAAQKYWHDDQGTGSAVTAAQDAYDEARANLLDALGIDEPRLVFRPRGRLHGDRAGQEVDLLGVESGEFVGVLFPDGARLLVPRREVVRQ